ncbi:DUF742 domain-containing protein [Streptomyces europaeiscabiei]|uniref:DUF742 domain-containing protein n=1 Tax=Streptomyces europaeiscabiei TaxID=146819 RepID=A0AAJ2PT85_9ACTN|nr:MULTISPECIES: DUF742 domain-containing protein [Streptomyces]KFF97733.1 hypothetical protein IQ62_29170 [Streptomyces scabiei]MDX3133264.1 DUF742 domain-containing protein [Streptomyces europaeiscabiei]WSG21815.1 DUF742 domain-containing protein [Streptomyces europaeiscabiei]
MTDEMFLDEEAGRLVRPFTVSNGRTRPSTPFDLLTLVMATGSRTITDLGPDHDLVLGLCVRPVPVVEVAARMNLPIAVTKVLLSDLVQHEALTARAPRAVEAASAANREVLEAVLDGLRARL